MPAKHPIRFGLQTPPEGATWEELVRVWKFADDLGYDSLWTSDHFITSLFPQQPHTPVFDGWTALAGLGVLAKRVRMGVMITGVPYRYPSQLAKIAVTIDRMTGGRLIMGIGASWSQKEHEQYGIEWRPSGERVHRMGEAIQVFKLLWTQPAATFNGRYYQLRDAVCEPKPVQKPHIPIWVGGWGEQLTLKYAALYGDGWNTTGSPISLPRKLEALQRHCEAARRDPGEIEKSVMHMRLMMTDDQAAVRRFVEASTYRRASGYEDLKGHYMMGTPAEMRELVGQFINLGVTHFVGQVVAPYDYETIERWYKEVALAFKR